MTFVYTISNVTLLLAILELKIVAVSFRQINENIGSFVRDQSNGSASDIGQKLKKWKSQHLLLHRFIAHWGKMFNMFLLINIFHIFLQLIVNAHYVLKNYSELKWAMFGYMISMIIQAKVMLLFLCSTASQVREEVHQTWSCILW